MEQTAIIRALLISEIQDRIFVLNRVGDAARCALVCRAWRDKALDRVWCELPAIWLFFNLLAPLVHHKGRADKCLVFSRRIRPDDWKRVAPYAKRVRYLLVRLDAPPSEYPHEAAFTDILLSRPDARTFPGLVKVKVIGKENYGRLRYIIPFLHDGLKTLVAHIRPGQSLSNLSDIENFLEEAATRANAIQDLRILLFTGITDHLEAILAKFIASQPSLKVAWLSSGALTPSIFQIVSQLPMLRQFSIYKKASKDVHPDSIKVVAAGDNVKVFFPEILQLNLQTRVSSIMTLLSSHTAFAQLEVLTVDMTPSNDAIDVQTCLEVISTTCKELYHLEFTRILDIGGQVSFQDDGQITKDTLAPLAFLPSLEQFSLTYTNSLFIGNDDLVDLLRRCAPLTALHLNPSPNRSSPSGSLPTLGCLHRIAECQPDLEHISINLAAYEKNDPDLPYKSNFSSQPFEVLKTFNIGNSHLDDVEWATAYLGQIIPHGCDFTLTMGRSREEWAEVKKRLPSLSRIFSEQRKRADNEVRGRTRNHAYS